MQELRAAIRAAGLRATPARLSVLRRLTAGDGPFSHAQLAEDLPEIDRATIYRNLADLHEAGLIRRERIGGVWRFQAGTHGEHPHLVCVDCGDVSCLSPRSVQVAADLQETVLEVQLRGRCGGCQ